MKGLLIVSLLLMVTATGAHEKKEGHEHRVVPDTERAEANRLRADGPQQNRGVESVRVLGEQLLTEEAWVSGQRKMRVREITIQPGGVVAVHQHQGRPGMAYILQGAIVEHRNDLDKPVTREQGAVSFEKTGVIHWWENTGDGVVRALVVDLVPHEDEPAGERD